MSTINELYQLFLVLTGSQVINKIDVTYEQSLALLSTSTNPVGSLQHLSVVAKALQANKHEPAVVSFQVQSSEPSSCFIGDQKAVPSIYGLIKIS